MNVVACLYIGIIYRQSMKCLKCLERVRRGNIDLSAQRKTRNYGIYIVSVLSLLCAFVSIRLINWDAAVFFYSPHITDIEHVASDDVDVHRLSSDKWKEKKKFITEVLSEACYNNNYQILTNRNVRILGNVVTDSVVYFCDTKRVMVNLNITPEKTNLKLECVETYAEHTVIRERWHPLVYTYYKDTELEQRITDSYEETCMVYQSFDLIKGRWKFNI